MSTPPRRAPSPFLAWQPDGRRTRIGAVTPRLGELVPGGTLRQLVTFGAIGAASTVAYVALYALLRGSLSATAANAIALIVTTIGNTAANRRLTFSVRGRNGLARDQAAGFLALGMALALTSGALVVLGALAPGSDRSLEVLVLVFANGLATLVRFLLLRAMIGRGLAGAPSSSDARGPVPVAVCEEGPASRTGRRPHPPTGPIS